jgi:RecA/RadA recombinase
MALNRRKPEEEVPVSQDESEIVNEVKSDKIRIEGEEFDLKFDKVISTGSTLLDLAISGGRVKGGGIPGGILAIFYGPAGGGKTAILSEIGASCQRKKGELMFLDPEARLDRQYAEIYGVHIDKDNYTRPDTVDEAFQAIWDWNPKAEGVTNVICMDSTAALSTEIEMEGKDKMGMKRAKDFSAGFRKTARLIPNKGWLVAASNQVRESDMGEVIPGGKAMEFYPSLIVRVGRIEKIIKKVTEGKKVIERATGIVSRCSVRKSSIDVPFRTAEIYITFGYGLDDIQANLQYLKDMSGWTTYKCPDGKTFQRLEAAIRYIEDQKLIKQLRSEVIDLWEKIDEKFRSVRKPKVR